MLVFLFFLFLAVCAGMILARWLWACSTDRLVDVRDDPSLAAPNILTEPILYGTLFRDQREAFEHIFQENVEYGRESLTKKALPSAYEPES